MNQAVNIPNKTILIQVEKVCLDPIMHPKQQLCRLFRYLITETLEGREDQLKGFTIGLEVFKRNKDFDPEQDPIVRINAGRLRRMLKAYYLTVGRNDPVKIDIPKGRYIPVFYSNDNTELDLKTSIKSETHPIVPSIAILPFQNLTGNTKKEYFGLGIAEELAVELSNFDDLAVFGTIHLADEIHSDDKRNEVLRNKGIRFIIEGSIHHIGNRVKLVAKLTDTFQEKQIWAERFSEEFTSDKLVELQEKIAHEISMVLGSEYGVILNRLLLESKRVNPIKNETFHAILRFHYFQAQQTVEATVEAMTTLQQAVLIDPESGIAAAMLANMYGTQYMLDLPGSNDVFEQYIALSEKAKTLEPNNLSVKVHLASVHFVLNDKEHFFRDVEDCLSLNPRSTFRLGILGFYICLYGDWERGKDILDEVMHMNVSFPVYFYGATTLYYYRNKKYDRALIEANQYDLPALFWAPMLRASVLGQLNQLSEAEANIAHLKQLRPDFNEKAHYLISRFVKEEELVEHILQGLTKAGMPTL